MRGYFLICSLLLSSAAIGATTFTFPIGPAAGAQYVRDSALIAVFPALKGVPRRMATCINSMTIPASGSIEFEPTVNGEHSALSNRLDCRIDHPEKLTCEEQTDASRAVVFDTPPADYFTLAPNTDRTAATAIFRAFRAATVEYATAAAHPWIKGLRLRKIARERDGYLVSFGNCGCSASLIVELHGTKVVATSAPDAICI